MSDPKPAADLNFRSSVGEICFDCPCGETEIILSEAGDEKTCRCRRVYTLVHHVTVQEPTNA